MHENGTIVFFLCGDVMTGRGIDQVLPWPAPPELRERYIQDANDYVRLAETANGPIARPVSYEHIWGEALPELVHADFRIVNLETSVTAGGEFWPRKPVHYRMHPNNIDCLTVAGIDCCSLANNHVLDFGYPGLIETLETLDGASLHRTGAGRDAGEARKPAILEKPAQPRVLVFGVGSQTSGIPPEWAATNENPGVFLLDDFSSRAAELLLEEIDAVRRESDRVIVSIHWGSNWGYEISEEQIVFAHDLIDGGVDIIHGHSSHHVRPLEVYRDRLILYGCGDFITDYEGIGGYERFRGDLGLMYFARIRADDGALTDLRMVPMQSNRFSLYRVEGADVEWLCNELNFEGRYLDTPIHLNDDATLSVELAKIPQK